MQKIKIEFLKLHITLYQCLILAWANANENDKTYLFHFDFSSDHREEFHDLFARSYWVSIFEFLSRRKNVVFWESGRNYVFFLKKLHVKYIPK